MGGVMRIISISLAVLLVASAAFAQDADFEALNRTVASLKGDGIRTGTQEGPDGIKVSCSMLPHHLITGIAFVIENPQRKVLDFKPADIRLSDQARAFDALAPAEVVKILYGEQINPKPVDPNISSQSASDYVMPAITRPRQKEKDIYMSAFEFGRTNDARVSGMVFYDRYGDREGLIAEIRVDGVNYRFAFQ
jgi:hypothetical protein